MPLTHVSSNKFSFTVTDSFSENSKFTYLCVPPSLYLSSKNYKVSHYISTRISKSTVVVFCWVNVVLGWNYISQNSYPTCTWLLVKKGSQGKFVQDLEDKIEGGVTPRNCAEP